STEVGGRSRSGALSVAGAMMIAIESYIYISGTIALSLSDLDAQTTDPSTSKKMSTLTFGAKNLRGFVGTGNNVFNSDGMVNDPGVLQSNGDIGAAVTLDEMALVVMKPDAPPHAPSPTSH